MGPRHFICGKRFDGRLGLRMERFWRTRFLDMVKADRAVIVEDEGQVVAFFRYLVGKFSAFRAVFALGTYVLPGYRRQRLARRMWDLAMKSVKPAFVNVYMTSRPAKKLIATIERRHPRAVFYEQSDFR